MRTTGFVLALALVPSATIQGQQPNSAPASLTVNAFDHGAGGSGPVTIQLANGGSLLATVSGAVGQPFLLATGQVVTGPGTALPPYGIVDLSSYVIVIDGFAPTQFIDLFAFVGATGQWQLAGTVSPTMSSFGLQGAVGDPGSAGGITLTAATDATVSNLTTLGHTYTEQVLGDDVTLTYHHQGLGFPFYGTIYNATHIDTNAYVSFGSITPSQPTATPSTLTGGPPLIAPYWSDMHMSSTVASTAGFTTTAPASIVVTETDNGNGDLDLQIEWRWATEAAGPSVRWDFGVCMRSSGEIQMLFGSDLPGGWMPSQSFSNAIVGISPGHGLSTAAPQTLLGAGGVVPVVGGPNDAIFEHFATPPFPLTNFFVPGASGQVMTFTPLGGPLGTSYQLSQQ